MIPCEVGLGRNNSYVQNRCGMLPKALVKDRNAAKQYCER